MFGIPVRGRIGMEGRGGRWGGERVSGCASFSLSLSSLFCFFFWVGVTSIRRSKKVNPEDADKPEQLVPIRLEFDVEHHKMRDTFVWNLNGTFVCLCTDTDP